MAFNPYYGYNQYPQYYQPAAMDNLAQLRQNQMNPQMMQQPAQSQPMNQSMGQPMQPMAAPFVNGTIWVQGEEGAKSYLVAPGNTVFLMDSEGPVFYQKTVNADGIPLPLRVFDFTERPQGTNGATKQVAQPLPPNIDLSGYVLREEFDALETKLNSLTTKFDSITTATRPTYKATKNKKEDVESGESAV